MKLVTLSQLISAIRTRADAESQTARHTDAWLTTEVNRSWTLFRTRLTRHGSPLFLKWQDTTLAAGPVAGRNYAEALLPMETFEVIGVDVSVSSNDVRPLQPISFAERNEFLSSSGSTVGTPSRFFIGSIGKETNDLCERGTIQLLPVPDRAYTLSIAYIPVWQDVTDPSYVFNSIAYFDEWVLWDVVLKIAARDNDMLGTAAIAAQKQQQVWDEIIAQSAATQRVGALQRVDAARMTRGPRRGWM